MDDKPHRDVGSRLLWFGVAAVVAVVVISLVRMKLEQPQQKQPTQPSPTETLQVRKVKQELLRRCRSRAQELSRSNLQANTSYQIEFALESRSYTLLCIIVTPS